MNKRWFVLAAALLAFSIAFTACGGGDSDDDTPFTFSYSGNLTIPKNQYAENNQQILSGSVSGSFKADEEYIVHITGTLSHPAIIQTAFVIGSVWEEFSVYATEPDTTQKPGVDGKYPPKSFEAGLLDTTITVKTRKASTSATTVVVQALKPGTTEADADRVANVSGVTITGALVTVAKAGEEPPPPPPPDENKFTFTYSGDVNIIYNSWDGGSNNQAVLNAGTTTNKIEEGKSYTVHITGALSHAGVLQVVFVDNDGGWKELSGYGGIGPVEAGAIDKSATVTAKGTASSTNAAANAVIIQLKKSADGNEAVSESGATLTGATVTVE
jgi:hypothetical protein